MKSPKTIDDLEFVDKEEKEFLKVVIYGKPGTGKTTFASTFPKPAILIDIGENGYLGVKNTQGLEIVKAKEIEDIETLYWYLKDNRDGIKTVIIDTVSALQDLALEEQRLAKNSKISKEHYGDFGTMTKKDWGEISSRLKSLITDYRDLNMNVVFIAHERVFNSEEEDTEGIDPSVGPRLMPSVSSTMNAAVDIVANTFIREKRVEDKSTMQYCLRIGPHSYYITKVRKPKDYQTENVLVDASYQDLAEIVKGD